MCRIFNNAAATTSQRCAALQLKAATVGLCCAALRLKAVTVSLRCAATKSGHSPPGSHCINKEQLQPYSAVQRLKAAKANQRHTATAS